jgi:signal transduction histidine kinase/ActR/RegA family two-component response regulator
MSINRKLTLVIVLTCAVALLLAGAGTIITELVTSRRAMVEEMTVLADLLARNSNAALSFHQDQDADEIRNTLSALQADPHIIAASVYDQKGVAFGDYVREGEARDLPAAPPALGKHFTTDYLEITRPVIFQGKRIGTIYLRADLGRMSHQIAMHALVVALVLLVTIIMTSALSPSLRRPIAEPILALARVARRIAKDRDYSKRAVKQTEDEVGLLTDAFNQMLSEIQRGQESLEGANKSMQTEIAERKAVEERLRAAHDELAKAKDVAEAASRAKDQFLAVLSHELRTPLTPVLLTISLLESRENLPEETHQDIETIRRHVELEARLIDDLLDLTRIARGKLQLTFETTDAHASVQDAVRTCCSSRMDDVRLSLDAQEHFVRADPGRFLQIFWNLLNNAKKFTPEGRTIAVRTSNPSPERIRIEVSDSGIGIEPAALPRIFNAFEQADSSFTRTFGGLGLGLTIAKALVDAHGGTISARSEGKGKGATFAAEFDTAPAPVAKKPAAPAAPSATQPAGSLRLLLVEDHEGTLRLLTKLLTSIGYDVSSAANIQAALSIADRKPIDLVISDLGLPDGSGLDLMRKLRDRHGLKGICLSGYGMEEDVARSLEAGFCQHLTKPVDLTKLESAIHNATSSSVPSVAT